MKFVEKYHALKELLYDTLNPLIAKKYWLVDCPFHSNIGDQLIWEGEIQFLESTERECIGFSSGEMFKFPKLSLDVTILYHGGGNLGALYREHMLLLLKLIEAYPNNRIVVFPQTVFYNDIQLLQSDVAAMIQHPDFHLCVRDKKGADILKNAGLRNVYLLPDMAFYIPLERFKSNKSAVKGSLYLKRVDGELAKDGNNVKADYVKDWPTFEKKIFDGIFIAKVLATLSRYKVPFCGYIWNWYANKVYRRDLINIGIDFINSYEPIVSTRLHAVILALLCGKTVTAVDNSYGKISQFVDTWLSDVEEIKMN